MKTESGKHGNALLVVIFAKRHKLSYKQVFSRYFDQALNRLGDVPFASFTRIEEKAKSVVVEIYSPKRKTLELAP